MNKVAKKRLNILVVEDEKPLAVAIKNRLEQNNCEVSTASTVKEALNCLKKDKTKDLVWLDHYLLGGEDGIDFVKKIRHSKGRTSKLPIFVVSNSNSGVHAKQYADLGIKNFYTKLNYSLDDIIGDINKSFNK